jgi:hypothetical protein
VTDAVSERAETEMSISYGGRLVLTLLFGALFKIDVLVPAEQLGQARSVLAELETAREIRAF